jgi:hypothetical protein
MPITCTCNCGREFTVPVYEAGQRWLCPGCSELMRVPVPPDVIPGPPPLVPELEWAESVASRVMSRLRSAASGISPRTWAIGLAAGWFLAVLSMLIGLDGDLLARLRSGNPAVSEPVAGQDGRRSMVTPSKETPFWIAAHWLQQR